jgi:hypothetical protein
MANENTCVWTGVSGKQYTYWWYTLPHSFKDGVFGNYIYAKIVSNEWVPIYIGEGDLGTRVGPSHHQADCIKRKGATHIHAHTQPDEAVRKAEEAGLLANYPQAYAPTGCNVKTGG